MSGYLNYKKVSVLPRFPRHGFLDLTYRCNNNCRHCWFCLPAGAEERNRELTFEEIRRIVDEARVLGSQSWTFFGGEPLLRTDFPDIFEYITSRSLFYTLNTNGTLITPRIARLLRRPGSKLIALCGATAEVHDHITRNPGSFEATMQGIAYLKEAGANFAIQLIPMRDNYHQFNEMIKLAQSLSPHYRVGAAWLYLSACRSPQRNAEIIHQRLDPKDVVNLDPPNSSYEALTLEEENNLCQAGPADDRLFARCIATRRDFHVDPYGRMSFCCFILDPEMRYDLRRGSFREAWEEFIPSLADKVKGGREYSEGCGSCDLRKECRWCMVYAYLEHGRYEAKIDYLCQVTREAKAYEKDWEKDHVRHFEIAGITIQVESDIPMTDQKFDSRFKQFEVDRPGQDTITIYHHFGLPPLNGQNLGEEVYRKPPWAIYRKGNSWIYLGISSQADNHKLHRVAVFSQDHMRCRIYNPDEEAYRQNGHGSLTLFPSDNVLLARVLADRQGCMLHSSGVIFDGEGLLFVGHSGAGKSSLVKMLKDQAKILCDDRNIIRRWPEGFRVYGTWSRGEVPIVSSVSAPLRAIFFLCKSKKNRVLPVKNRKRILGELLSCVIKPFVTADWWQKTLLLIQVVSEEVPCFDLEFDKSGQIARELADFVKRF